MSAELRHFHDIPSETNKISGMVVDCAFQVHKELGPGFLENNYEDALAHELNKLNLKYKRQTPFRISYKDIFLQSEYRFDLVVEDQVLVELKAVDKIHPVHQAQIYAYLKATELPLGLLINFNVPLIKNGIGRYVLRNSESPR